MALAVAASLLILGLTLSGSGRWLGHGFAGLLGLVAGGAALVAGARIAGRFPGQGSYAHHRRLGIVYTAAMVLVFGYGLVVAALSHRLLLGTVHGWLGLSIAALASFQVTSSLLIHNRKGYRAVHRVIGYATVLLTVVQCALGLACGLARSPSVLAVSHSTLGVIAVAALIWVLVELHLSQDLSRARFAGWLAAGSVLGAWPLAGYMYLKFYGARYKPVILHGKWPWAHALMMETKEHVFLLLPVIVVVLALVLAAGRTWQVVEPEQAADRRAASFIAWLALAVLAIMLVFGSFVSAAAHAARV